MLEIVTSMKLRFVRDCDIYKTMTSVRDCDIYESMWYVRDCYIYEIMTSV